METDLELKITEADLERMQVEVDEAFLLSKEEQKMADEEEADQTKTA